MRLRTKRFGAKWWIAGDADWLPCGPYDTKADADEDRRGLVRALQNQDDRTYFTTERERDDEATKTI